MLDGVGRLDDVGEDLPGGTLGRVMPVVWREEHDRMNAQTDGWTGLVPIGACVGCGQRSQRVVPVKEHQLRGEDVLARTTKQVQRTANGGPHKG